MSSILPSRPRIARQRRSFAIVAAQYHPELVGGLIENTRRELMAISAGFHIELYEVPGAFEVPLAVSEVAARGGFDAIIALGVIIEGQTAHAGLIAQTITASLQQISLAAHVPVIHEVLLVKNEEQARARCLGEEINRGTEAARAAVRMAEVLGTIRGQR
jgi:6,7-dimethyl-8-ribityllumazine synthase